MELTFASYNIRKAIGLDRKRDPERIVAILRELDADVIALQEADRRIGSRSAAVPRVLLDDTKWRPLPIAMRPRSIGWHGNALLVRRDIEVAQCDPVALPTLEPRGAVCAELSLDGRPFRVIGAHLDISGIRRRDQIRAILRHVAASATRCPTVLMGDFNQWGLRTGAMTEFGDGWQLLLPGRSFHARRPVAYLDRIVATEAWQVAGTGVHHSALSARGSDHLPIWARLGLPEL